MTLVYNPPGIVGTRVLFNSHIFIFVFLPVTLLVYFALGKNQKPEAAIGWLVFASLAFYGYWKPIYLLLIGVSITANFLLGQKISQQQDATSRKWVMILGVCFNLGLLIYFKYTNFLLDSLNVVAGTNYHLDKIILPLAISFFTFQQIAYLVDAYQQETAETNFLHYCLFVCFFPQLIAGPIVHHKEMLTQFSKPSTFKFNADDFSVGLSIFIIGLFKKVVLADGVAVYATPVFAAADAGQAINFYDAWAGTIAYTLQIYFDFSGYSDMAIGLARMFGIKLPLNFHSPYKSESIVEFWRRWHMTLSRFLRDYLYIALGGNRSGKIKRYRNLFLTMLLGGIWHGAGWNFLIWGGLHGSYLMVNHAWRAIKGNRKLILGHPMVNRMLAIALTTLAVMFAWVFFRAETFEGAMIIVESMLGFNGLPAADLQGAQLTSKDAIEWFIALALIAWFAPNTQEIMRRFSPAVNASDYVSTEQDGKIIWAPTGKWALLLALVGLYTILSLNRVSEFLYFQF